MPARTLLKWPNKDLRIHSDPILPGEDINSIISDLRDTMIANFGLGIAAPQIGIRKNVVVVKASSLPDFNPDPNYKDLVILINPEVEFLGKQKIKSLESCLSVEDFAEQVERHKTVRVKYTDSSWSEKVDEVSLGQSSIVQHECDHLVGKLFINRLSLFRYKKFISRKKREARLNKLLNTDFEAAAEQKIKTKRTALRNARKKRKKR